jgi:hypothetical protein
MASGNTNRVSGCACREQTVLEARHIVVAVAYRIGKLAPIWG